MARIRAPAFDIFYPIFFTSSHCTHASERRSRTGGRSGRGRSAVPLRSARRKRAESEAFRTKPLKKSMGRPKIGKGSQVVSVYRQPKIRVFALEFQLCPPCLWQPQLYF